MNEELLRKKIKETYPNESDIDVAIYKISLFKPELIKAFVNYVETGMLPEINIDGNTIYSISEKTHLDYTEAFFIMDKLMKDDDYKYNFKDMNFGRK